MDGWMDPPAGEHSSGFHVCLLLLFYGSVFLWLKFLFLPPLPLLFLSFPFIVIFLSVFSFCLVFFKWIWVVSKNIYIYWPGKIPSGVSCSHRTTDLTDRKKRTRHHMCYYTPITLCQVFFFLLFNLIHRTLSVQTGLSVIDKCTGVDSLFPLPPQLSRRCHCFTRGGREHLINYMLTF